MLQIANLSKVLTKFECNEDSFNKDVDNLEMWLKTQTHLPELMDKKRIASFLLLNKCNIEITKTKIDKYYTVRSQYPEFYLHHPNEDGVQQGFKMTYFVPLPKVTKDGQRITIIKVRDPTLVDTVDPLNVVLSFMYTSEMRLFLDNVYEDIFIYDMENVTMSYLTKLIPIIPKCLHLWGQSCTLSIKALYILNPKPFLPTLLNMGKSLLKPKIFNRIHILENENLLDLFPKEIIPKEYSGEEKSLEELRFKWIEMIKSNENFFDDRLNKRVNENLRVELTNNETLGYYGNFKKLNVD